jgi:hypothetical protein
MPRSNPNKLNGLYSFFIRGTSISLKPRDIDRLREIAAKIYEAQERVLMIGRNWIVLMRKIHMSESEYEYLRCFNDICEPHNEIEPKEVLDDTVEPVSVDVSCVKVRGLYKDTEDYECRIRYHYVMYDAIIGIAIDARDIVKVDNDKELQLLLELMKTDRILIRPM